MIHKNGLAVELTDESAISLANDCETHLHFQTKASVIERLLACELEHRNYIKTMATKVHKWRLYQTNGEIMGPKCFVMLAVFVRPHQIIPSDVTTGQWQG